MDENSIFFVHNLQNRKGVVSMNLTANKKTLALSGVLLGAIAAVLAYMGNPKNMAMCIACFIRDTAGAMKLHQAGCCPVRASGDHRYYLRRISDRCCHKGIPVHGRLLPHGAFCAGYDHDDRLPGILRLPAAYGAPYAAGDLNAYVALIGFVAGVFTGTWP